MEGAFLSGQTQYKTEDGQRVFRNLVIPTHLFYTFAAASQGWGFPTARGGFAGGEKRPKGIDP
jgi:hypothetical protein